MPDDLQDKENQLVLLNNIWRHIVAIVKQKPKLENEIERLKAELQDERSGETGQRN